MLSVQDKTYVLQAVPNWIWLSHLQHFSVVTLPKRWFTFVWSCYLMKRKEKIRLCTTNDLSLRFVSLWRNSPTRARVASFMRFLDHTQSVGLLWTRDRPVAETSTWQYTTLTTDRHPCARRDFFFSVLHLYYYFVLIVLAVSFVLTVKHTQQTNIHAPGGIQTRNPSKRSAADPRLRPPGHWNRLSLRFTVPKCSLHEKFEK